MVVILDEKLKNEIEREVEPQIQKIMDDNFKQYKEVIYGKVKRKTST